MVCSLLLFLSARREQVDAWAFSCADQSSCATGTSDDDDSSTPTGTIGNRSVIVDAVSKLQSRRVEKNWSPFVYDGELYLSYWLQARCFKPTPYLLHAVIAY